MCLMTLHGTNIEFIIVFQKFLESLLTHGLLSVLSKTSVKLGTFMGFMSTLFL